MNDDLSRSVTGKYDTGIFIKGTLNKIIIGSCLMVVKIGPNVEPLSKFISIFSLALTSSCFGENVSGCKFLRLQKSTVNSLGLTLRTLISKISTLT